MATEEKQVGLECLDDECLAAIVESQLSDHGKLTYEAEIALQELKRRTPDE